CRVEAPAQVADVASLHQQLPGRDFMLDGKVELLYVAGPEAGENAQHRARWILRSCEVDGRLGRKTVPGAQPHVDVTRADRVNGAEGDAAGQPEGSVQRAGRIV